MNLQLKRFRGRLFGVFLVTIFLVAACASSSDPMPVTLPTSAIPTLTPFQPQSAGNENLLSSPVLPLLEPTYTPYPTRYVITENLPLPIQVSPADGVADLAVYNPLTGLPVSDPTLLNRRPMVVKIGNAPDYVRPQSGLTLADVVFEYYIEWGESRFIAVMYGNDSPMVGPVRSGRYFDEHIARMYNAFLMFKGADPRELSYLENSTLKDFLVIVYSNNSACPPVIIGPARRDSYNNAFFDTTRWASCAAKKGLDNSRQLLSGGFFTEQPPQSDLAVTRIFTHFSDQSYNYWEYDPLTRKYFRYQEANDITINKPEAYTPLSDAQTGLPVTADNVVILFVPHIFANQYDADDEVYHIDLVDFGNAYVFRDGVAIPAQWNRMDEDQPILLTDLLGNPIYMHPGRTFYEVLGVNSSYTQTGSDWKFFFATP